MYLLKIIDETYHGKIDQSQSKDLNVPKVYLKIFKKMKGLGFLNLISFLLTLQVDERTVYDC